MATTSPQLASNKVLTTAPSGADPGRYKFISLQNAEPNLSLPVKISNNDARFFLLSDPLSGTRFWSTSGSISLSGNKVGIGTSTPNENLTVTGSISASDFIYGTFAGTILALSGAAGNDTEVQFNSGGVLAASPAFTYIDSVSSLKVGTSHTVGASAFLSSILGGSSNVVTSTLGGVTFGLANSATSIYAIVNGGSNNAASGQYSVINGGCENISDSNYSVVGGGQLNKSSGVAATVAGGRCNCVNSDYSSILGGCNNKSLEGFSSIVGGATNTIDAEYTFIGGGVNNTANGDCTVIAGGSNNTVTANFGGIVGGNNNTVSHINSFTIGSNLQSAAANTTFVNNLSSPGTVAGSIVSFTTLQSNSAVTTVAPELTEAFLTINVGGSALGIPLYRL
jgi:hypothetical protein